MIAFFIIYDDNFKVSIKLLVIFNTGLRPPLKTAQIQQKLIRERGRRKIRMLSGCWVLCWAGGNERKECYQDCLPCIGTSSGYLRRIAIRREKLKVKVWVSTSVARPVPTFFHTVWKFILSLNFIALINCVGAREQEAASKASLMFLPQYC